MEHHQQQVRKKQKRYDDNEQSSPEDTIQSSTGTTTTTLCTSVVVVAPWSSTGRSSSIINRNSEGIKILEWSDPEIVDQISQVLDLNANRMDQKYQLPPELSTIDFTERVSWGKYAPYNPSRSLSFVPIDTEPQFNSEATTKQSKTLCHYIHAISGRARACTIHFLSPQENQKQGDVDTIHSTRQRPLPTPMFMPVGTKGCLKALSIVELTTDPALQCPIILANTYHLAIQPGTDLVREMGGLHTFQGLDNWIRIHKEKSMIQTNESHEMSVIQQKHPLPYNLLTDSGGFQMVSLAKLSEVTEEGVSFENPYNQRNTGATTTTTVTASLETETKGYDKNFLHCTSTTCTLNDNVQTTLTTDSINNDMRADGRIMEKFLLKNASNNNNNNGDSSVEIAASNTIDSGSADILLLRPEDSIRHQHNIGSNIMMALDDVISSVTVDEQRFVTATHRTLRWYDRCYKYHHDTCSTTTKSIHQNLFPIVQGGLDTNFGGLREQCLAGFRYRELECHYDVPGYSIGGLAGGEAKDDFWKVVDLCCKALPDNKPRYLMGVGYPLDLVVCTALGVDLYDCVYPTRTARFGVALVPGKHPGTLKLSSNQCGRDTSNVIQKDCLCQACRMGITRSRLHILLKSGNPVAVELITQHNIAYMMALVRGMRQAILEDAFSDYAIQFVKSQFPGGDVPTWVVDALAAAGITIS